MNGVVADPRWEVHQVQADGCRFCSIADGTADQWWNRRLWKSPNYVAVASIGALRPGWTLLVPREHEFNLGARYRTAELVGARRYAASRLQRAWQVPVRMFEHGATHSNSRIGCGVDHAHLHLVPFAHSLLPSCNLNDWITARASQVKEIVGDFEYLLYSDAPLQDDPECFVQIVQNSESQFFRRAIASVLGMTDSFDYRAFPMLDKVSKTQRVWSASAAVEDETLHNHRL